MHTRLLAVGSRQAAWVDEAVTSYTARLPREWHFRIDVVATVKRKRNEAAARATLDEGQQLLGRIGANEQVILLDERGTEWTSRELAERLFQWQSDGRDLCFIIGGPDGVSSAVSERADASWSLSKLTLPHGLARVLFVEQLYRANSLQAGHPYHRD
ncbi:MAG TPA: 23S rRNA (pseudouridine(1915)-N(3))-methyltransferase RlmH [Woeseiaceae bacterium]|nr:23S rRNA (pseudouridine(1915)-N(3))-methyltransferase RlmH [Woeseiaceae bacterium]